MAHFATLVLEDLDNDGWIDEFHPLSPDPMDGTVIQVDEDGHRLFQGPYPLAEPQWEIPQRVNHFHPHRDFPVDDDMGEVVDHYHPGDTYVPWHPGFGIARPFEVDEDELFDEFEEEEEAEAMEEDPADLKEQTDEAPEDIEEIEDDPE